MVNFNLLPWRSYTTRYQSKKLKYLFCWSFIGPIFLILALYYLVTQALTHSQQQILALQVKIQSLNPNAVASSTDAPNMIQAKAYQMLTNHLFSLLNLPEAVCLQKITRNNNVVQFYGYSYSSEDLFEFLEYWENKSFFKSIQVKKLQQKSNHLLYFHLYALEKQKFAGLNEGISENQSL